MNIFYEVSPSCRMRPIGSRVGNGLAFRVVIARSKSHPKNAEFAEFAVAKCRSARGRPEGRRVVDLQYSNRRIPKRAISRLRLLCARLYSNNGSNITS